MAIWTLAKKELRLLLRDRRAVVILLAMPTIFILILGMSLGEGFGQKPDERLRVSLVDLDRGDQPVVVREVLAWLARLPALAAPPSAVDAQGLGVALLLAHNQLVRPPKESWAKVVQRDLDQTAGIRVEIIPTRQEAERLVRQSKRSAVLVFGPLF